MRNPDTITRRQFVKRGALWVASSSLAVPKIARAQFLPHRRKAFRSSAGIPSGSYLLFKPESLVGANDTTCAQWDDTSGSGLHATQSTEASKPIHKTGTFGSLTSLYYADVVDILTTASVSHGIGTGDFTWAVWAKALNHSSTYTGLMGNGSFAPAMYSELSGTNWGAFWTSDRASGNVLSTSTWYHLVFMREGGTLKFFQNNVQTGTTHSVSTSMSNAVCHIGASAAGSGGEKNMAFAGAWARALNGTELTNLYGVYSP